MVAQLPRLLSQVLCGKNRAPMQFMCCLTGMSRYPPNSEDAKIIGYSFLALLCTDLQFMSFFFLRKNGNYGFCFVGVCNGPSDFQYDVSTRYSFFLPACKFLHLHVKWI